MSIEEAEAKARELSVMFIETSAKAGFNIKVTGVVSSLHNFFRVVGGQQQQNPAIFILFLTLCSPIIR